MNDTLATLKARLEGKKTWLVLAGLAAFILGDGSLATGSEAPTFSDPGGTGWSIETIGLGLAGAIATVRATISRVLSALDRIEQALVAIRGQTPTPPPVPPQSPAGE